MEPKPRILTIMDMLSILLIVAATVVVLFYTPIESYMGNVQKVFYFHVATGWVGMLAFLVAVASGIKYLQTGEKKWDIRGLAGIELGLVFSIINIASGSIWARPIWNTWWTWDPRLVTATIVVLVYFAYFMLRHSIEDEGRQARFGAIYAIVGFVSVPLSFLSIRFFRTIHPVLIGSADPSTIGAFNMIPEMRVSLFFSLFVFTIIGISLFWHR